MLPASLSAKWLPRDLVEASQSGGVATLVAYAIMLAISLCELRAFLVRVPLSSLLLEGEATLRSEIQLNLDIDMYGVDCRNLNVVVIDQLRHEPVRAPVRELRFRGLGPEGGMHAVSATNETEEEEHQRTVQQLAQTDGSTELDADWADSHDGFKHQSFEHVIQFHDFTLINFFAGWCSHCQKFAPTWRELGDQVKARTFQDRDGKERKVAPIRVNCVDFKELCQGQGVNAFPTIRLYKSDGSVSPFESRRDISTIVAWLELVLRTKSFGWRNNHKEIGGGCNVRGYMRFPRVPGHLELTAGAGDQNLHPEMTNTSHAVNQFSFKDPSTAGGWRLWSSLPSELAPMTSPMDGRRFLTDAVHQVYEHHLRLVGATAGDGLSYQFVHFGRTANVGEQEVPQVRFHFDLEPFAIQVEFENKKWYEFVTSLLAALGGIFAVMRLLSRAVLTGSSLVAGPSRRGGSGLLT